MRAAPPVDAALDAGRRERVLTVLLHMLAGLVLAAWLALQAGVASVLLWAGALGLGVVAMGAIGGWLARCTWPRDPGRLRWDGSQWLSTSPGAARPLPRVVVSLDLGTWMLLQLHPADGTARLWRVASPRAARGAWHGLRVALAAHAGAPQAGENAGADR
jgi:hypothetical protein